MSDQLIDADPALALLGAAKLEACLLTLATSLGQEFAARGLLIATAESCTGGAIARALTETPGSSSWFDCAFVTYSNAAKMHMLNVPAALLDAHGAVSGPVARAMALGALAGSNAHVAVAVTGVAGPGGGSPDKPVGMVWFGWASAPPTATGAPQVNTQVVNFAGDRSAVRLQTAIHALVQLRQLNRAAR